MGSRNSRRKTRSSRSSRRSRRRSSASSKKLYKPFVSKSGYKKYSVYVRSSSGGVKLIHFGDKRYQQYHDKIGHYRRLDHGDEERRDRYRMRHKKDRINDRNTPGYWSWHYLW